MASSNTKAPRWNHEDYDLMQLLKGNAGRFLCEYSKILPAEQESHVKSIREKGWAITKYPCFSRFLFLHFDLANSFAYPRILDGLKEGALFLDLGCCLGQDIRRLVYDGAPSENTLGIELSPELVGLGFDLFHDQGKLKTSFIIQDFLHDTPTMDKLQGKITFLNSGFFLHLWDWYGQVRVAKRMVNLVVPRKGALITGVSAGSLAPGEWANNPHGGPPMFLHDNNTFSQLWRQIEAETKTKWKVYTTLDIADGFDELRQGDNGGRLQRWVVERLV